MTSRSHRHAEEFAAATQAIFELLITPSSIRQWWSASAAIVMPQVGGTWAARWGDEDMPDYLTSAEILEFSPPHRLVLGRYQYWARAGALPFEADFCTEFEVEALDAGSRLIVTQSGFPAGAVADEHFAACQKGWNDTFAGIRRFLSKPSES